jgi:hypothetical protein
LVPADWFTVPLGDVAARRKAVAGLVTRQAGRGDEAAPLRARLRRELNQVADQAASAGGTHLAVSLMVAGGMPIPASLTVYRTGIPTAVVSPEELARMLDVGEADVFTGEDRTVLRRVRSGVAPQDVAESQVPQLLIDYWLSLDGLSEVLALSFSSPLVQVREPLIDLFNVIADSVSVDDEGPQSPDDLPNGAT